MIPDTLGFPEVCEGMQCGGPGEDPVECLDPDGTLHTHWADPRAWGSCPQCVSLDKLEALPSEAALVSRALQLLAEQRFWAGIVFPEPEDPADPSEMPAPDLGPGHVRIKIRMDIDDVTRTNRIRDRWEGAKLWWTGPTKYMQPRQNLGAWPRPR